MLNMLYLHGFGSSFDPHKAKVVKLTELGTVTGPDIDYTKNYPDIKEMIDQFISNIPKSIDLIVGTSMGGWLASQAGSGHGIPFVSLNPIYDPQVSLPRLITDLDVVNSYPRFNETGCGLIMFELGDAVLPESHQVESMHQYINLFNHDAHLIKVFEGGSHRFENLHEMSIQIQAFYNNAALVYGLDET